MTEIPKRKFALEEKDLSVEADENNKVAEEKENRFLKKLQSEATDKIEHYPLIKYWNVYLIPQDGEY